MLELGVVQVNLDFGRLGTVNEASGAPHAHMTRRRREPEEPM